MDRLSQALKDLRQQVDTNSLSPKCMQNVIAKLNNISGFSLAAFGAYLDQPANFYDGRKSTVSPVGSIYPTQQVANLNYANCATVQAIFSNNPGTNALTSETSSTLTTYFGPGAVSGSEAANMALLFHEALHGFGNTVGTSNPLFDSALQQAFGLPVGAATQNISDYVRKNCF